ncbi:MAG: acyl-CoA dehydrogenase family protein, partial [Actinomycetota bacterium]
MDFEFDETQKMFRQSLREFLEKEIAPMVDEQEKKGPMNKDEALEIMRKFKKIGVGFDVESLSDMASDPLATGIMAEETFRVWPSAAGLVGLSFPAALVN